VRRRNWLRRTIPQTSEWDSLRWPKGDSQVSSEAQASVCIDAETGGKGCFRPTDSGGNWLRLFSATQLFLMTTPTAFMLALLIQLFLTPAFTLILLVVGGLVSCILPAIAYQLRYGSWFGWRWSVSFSLYGLFTLSWIPVWGLLTATRSGWLTRSLPATVPTLELNPKVLEIVDCIPCPVIMDSVLSAKLSSRHLVASQ